MFFLRKLIEYFSELQDEKDVTSVETERDAQPFSFLQMFGRDPKSVDADTAHADANEYHYEGFVFSFLFQDFLQRL